MLALNWANKRNISNSYTGLMKKISITIVLSFCVLYLVAQINQGGTPLSFSNNNDIQSMRIIQIDPPDILKIQQEDRQNDSLFLPRRFSVLIPTEINLLESGSLKQLKNGDRLYMLKLEAKEALAVNLYFSRFYLPDGAKMFLYDDQKGQIKGAFTKFNNPESGYFATELLAGESVILELYLPAKTTEYPEVHISNVGYAYRDVPEYDQNKGFGSSDWCEINVNCSPEGDNWQIQKKAVVRILVKVNGAGFWCTGSLVNNVLNDATPYVLTADHCAFQLNQYASTTDLDQWIFYFNYESANCENPITEPELLSMTGATKIAQGGNRGLDGSDFYLIRLNNSVPTSYNPHFLGWSRIDEISNSGVTIHHPDGDIKKISTYVEPVESSPWLGNGLQSHWKVVWTETENNWGVTESGSSGSPLFNEDGKLMGTLTGGLAACDAVGSLGPDKPDYYGKFSYHWQLNGTSDTAQLKPWLDPENTGITVLEGLTLGIDNQEIVNNFEINIYPNPAEAHFFINFNTLEATVSRITMFDVFGKLIKDIPVQKEELQFKVDITGLATGVYIVKCHTEKLSYASRVVVQ
jgi:hypothetical protein